MYLSDISLLKHPIFYIYNFIIFYTFILYFCDIKKIEFLIVFFKLTVFFLFFFTLLFFDGGSLRQHGGFNNPNQLGLAALILLCILYFVRPNDFLSLKNIPFVLMCIVCSILSFSLTSIVCCLSLIVYFLLFLDKNDSLYKKLVTYIIIFIIFVFLLYLVTQLESLVNSFESRFSVIGRKIEEAYEVRGYSRLVNYYQYLIFGAAESGFYRYNVRDFEIHSLFAGLLFSYGLFGFSIFVMFLVSIHKKFIFKEWFIILLPMLYSLTHFTFRDTGLWLFWAVLLIMYRMRLSNQSI
jgi:hypothetical protein